MPVSQPAMQPATGAKPRSQLKTSIASGGILVLLAMTVVEYSSQQAHSNAVESLSSQFQRAAETHTVVRAADVKAAVGRKTPAVQDVTELDLPDGSKRLEVYRWFSILPAQKRELFVYFGAGDDADVLSLSTESQFDTFPEPKAAADVRR
jgi:hypothetical protein